MKANLDLVRSIYADWERGEFDSADWAHPEIEYVSADGFDPGTWTGLAKMAEQFGAWLRLWEGFRLTADGYRQIGPETVLVLDHLSGRGKTSGLQLDQLQTAGGWLFPSTAARSRGWSATSTVTAPSPTSAWRSRRCPRSP